MRKICGAVFQLLDGVIQGPGGPDEDPTGGFGLGGWTKPLADAATDGATDGALGASLAPPPDLLPGRRTCDIFAGYWPQVAADHPVGQAFNAAATYVLTRGNRRHDWQNSHRLDGIDAARRQKATDGLRLLLWGSSTLYPQPLAGGLIDRLHLLTYPLTLGRGKRLSGDGTPALRTKPALRMALVESVVPPSALGIATQDPGGVVTTDRYPGPTPSPAELDRRARMARDDTWQQKETR